MCDFYSVSIPWRDLITGVVGIAGIAGTCFGVVWTNRAADTRRVADREHEDRTRFHKERAELYARFLQRSKEHSEAAVNAVAHGLARKAIPSTPQEVEMFERCRNAWTALEEAGAAIELMSTEPVRAAAESAMRAADVLFTAGRSAAELPQLEATRQNAVDAFKAATRAELLPKA